MARGTQRVNTVVLEEHTLWKELYFDGTWAWIKVCNCCLFVLCKSLFYCRNASAAPSMRYGYNNYSTIIVAGILTWRVLFLYTTTLYSLVLVTSLTTELVKNIADWTPKVMLRMFAYCLQWRTVMLLLTISLLLIFLSELLCSIASAVFLGQLLRLLILRF